MRYKFGVVLFIVYCVFVVVAQSEAADVVNYNFTTDINVTYAASHVGSAVYNDSNLNDSYIGDDGFGNVLETYPSTGSTSVATALTNNSYFFITITPTSGNVINLSQLVFEVGKGGSEDPRGYFVRSSADGFTTDIVGETLPTGANTAPVIKTISLTGYQNLSSVTFRFYVYTPDPTFNSVDFRNISFQYDSTPTTVPTLSEWGMMLFVILLAGIAVWTMKKSKAPLM
jgi:hypothetical protein